MRICVLVANDVFDTGLAAVLDTFEVANELAGERRFDVVIASPRPGPRTHHGLSIPSAPLPTRALDLVIAVVGVCLVACGGVAAPPPNNVPTTPHAAPVDLEALHAACEKDIDNIDMADGTGIKISKRCDDYLVAGYAIPDAAAATDEAADLLCAKEFSGVINTAGLSCRLHAIYIQDHLDPNNPMRTAGMCAAALDMGCMYHDTISCDIRHTGHDASGRVWTLPPPQPTP